MWSVHALFMAGLHGTCRWIGCMRDVHDREPHLFNVLEMISLIPACVVYHEYVKECNAFYMSTQSLTKRLLEFSTFYVLDQPYTFVVF